MKGRRCPAAHHHAAREDDPKRADMGRVFERIEVINQHGEVVLVADHIYSVERKNKPA